MSLKTLVQYRLSCKPQPIRYEDDAGLEGTTAEMVSDVVMPDTRMPAQSELGK